jgi:hypothetical protein
MGETVRRIRPQLTYANVMSTLAVFLLLAGGGAYAAGKLKKNSVKSKHIASEAVTGDDASEATFGKVPSAGTADYAGTAGTANSVPASAIGPGNIADVTRSVNLPLNSFRNATDGGTAFDSDSGDDDNAPDWEVANNSLSLVWDDDFDGPAMSNDLTDSDRAITTLMVPPDYVSGATVVLRASRQTDTAGASEERLRCNTTINNGAVTNTINAPLAFGTAVGLYFLPLDGTYGSGDAVDVRCFADGGSAGDVAFNDPVELRAIEFEYTAQQ